MKLHASLIAAACALALSACGGGSDEQQPAATSGTAPVTDPAAPAGTTPGNEAGSQAPAGQPAMGGDPSATGTAGSTADTGGNSAAGGIAGTAGTAGGDNASGEAAVTGCSVDISGNDMMRYDVSSITIPSSCSQFTINLTHVGRLPEAAMGHNVVITSDADMAAVAADGISAGADAGYVKPDDDRVIAATEMIGGGESTSVTFDVSKMQAGGSYRFFCSFPGHAALMNGTIRVG
ncbi:MAG TPA: azurin [Luteimonas sp.]